MRPLKALKKGQLYRCHHAKGCIAKHGVLRLWKTAVVIFNCVKG
jgi:hypothetical protein